MKTHIELDYQGETLRGYLDTPSEEGPHPLVIMFHGFTGDCTEKKYLLTRLAGELASHGIASQRLSFRGCGESDGDHTAVSCRNQADQIKAILTFSRSLPNVDPDRIILLGMSMGGAAATLAAAGLQDQLRGLILLAPAFRYADKFRHRYDETGIFWHGNLPVGRAFLEDARPEAFRAALKEITIPVHFFHGTNDTSVLPAVSMEFVSFTREGRLFLIEGGDHGFDSRDSLRELFQGIHTSVSQFLTI